MPKGPCKTCLALEPYSGGIVGSCHADPMPMKIKDYTNWWCNRYEPDPAKIKALEDAEKAAQAAAKKLASAKKRTADEVISEGVEKLQGDENE